jgi:hypothetical protein
VWTFRINIDFLLVNEFFYVIETAHAFDPLLEVAKTNNKNWDMNIITLVHKMMKKSWAEREKK